MSGIKDYDRVFRKMQESKRATVLFIDEIHALDQLMATKLYKVMEDGLYAFHGELNPVPMPPIMVVGATTDYGDMHAALKRRFGEPIHLEKLDRMQLGRLAQSKPEPIDDAAVLNLVRVTQYSGAPWELLSLLGEADLIRRAEKAPAVTGTHVNRVFRALDLDEYGLQPVDRYVLTALFRSPQYRENQFTCFALSQADIYAQTKLDPGEFSAVIKPRLQSRSLITTRSGYGLVLTEGAGRCYERLCPDEHKHHLKR